MDGHDEVPLPSDCPRPFQFSLRTLFIVTTIVAILCAGLSARAPRWYSLYTFISWATILPLSLIAIVIYARGPLRAFGIGGLFACLPLLAFDILVGAATLGHLAHAHSLSAFSNYSPFDHLGGDDPIGPTLSLIVGLQSLGTAILGLVAVVVRRIAEPRELRDWHDWHAAVPRAEPTADDKGSPDEGCRAKS
ncbi:MAG: hypothetical protein ABFC96_18660 [Thermoguttaceae bacterium]